MNSENSALYPAIVQESLPSVELRKPAPPYDNDFAMRDYLERFNRHKTKILAVMGGFVLLALVISLLMKPVYKAQATLELNTSAPRVTKFEDLVADQSQPDAFLQTQVELFQSTSLAGRVIENLQMANNPAFNPFTKLSKDQMNSITKLKAWLSGLIGTIKIWLNLREGDQDSNPDLEKLKQEKTLHALFAQNLDVQPKAGTNIISVSFSSTDPYLARNATNELINEFINWQMKRKMDSTKAAKSQLEKQINSVRDQLSQAEERFSNFANDAGIVSFDSKSNLIFQELEQINQALAAIVTERITKKEIYKEAMKSDVDSLPFVIQNVLIQNLKNQYSDLKSEYEKLRIVYKADYPEPKRIMAKMMNLNSRISAEQKNILNSLKTEYLAAMKVEKALAAKAEEKKASALKVNEMAGQYKILEHKVEMNKQIYLSLLERSKEIDANVGTDLGNIQLVDFAFLPLESYKPNIILNILVAAVLGLMCGSGLFFLMEYMDNTIKRVDEISDRYGIPLLAVLPIVEKKDLICTVPFAQQQTTSIFSEAIRFARLSILFSCAADTPAKALLITSTAANEGKSTISVNLAHSFAEAGEKVLLIDADLRKPSTGISDFNGRKYGLVHYLSGLVEPDAIIHQTKKEENLYFIHSGFDTTPNPTELLDSNRMKFLIEDLMNSFDRIIFDGPPFGSDVLVLANRVDGVILITTLGKTQHTALQVARKYLTQTNGRLLGSIVNKVNLSKYPETRHYQNCYSYKGFKAENYLLL